MDSFSLVLCLKKIYLIYSKLILDFLEFCFFFFPVLKWCYWNSQKSLIIRPCFVNLLIIFFPNFCQDPNHGEEGRQESQRFDPWAFPSHLPIPNGAPKGFSLELESEPLWEKAFIYLLLSQKLSEG